MSANNTLQEALRLAIHGVPGWFKAPRVPPSLWKSGTFASQAWVSAARPIKGYNKGSTIRVEMRFDDQCKTGHNDFAVTAHVVTPGGRDWDACGCLHDDVAEVFPELAHMVKWHLTSSDGPMHYVANTVYLAGDRDCHGLKKGESRQIRHGGTGALSWKRAAVDTTGREIELYAPEKYADGAEPPIDEGLAVKWVPWCRIGEGKERQLDAARRCAVWPEATDEQMCLPKDELATLLNARLPAMLVDFRRDIEACGFLWTAAEVG